MTEPTKSNDVDATWDGTGSLDDHRQKAFAQIEQPGFGAGSKKPESPPAEVVNPIIETEVEDTDDGE